jgi:DNA polymerase III sliding clamp (beta) subunit (PCNA family)
MTDDVSISASHLRALITRINRTKADTVELAADGAIVARVQSGGLDASFVAQGDHGGVLPAVVVPIRALAKAAGVLDGVGYLSVADGYLVARFGGAVVRIKAGEPMVPEPGHVVETHLTDAAIIASAFDRVIYAAAPYGNRYGLNGIAIEKDDAGSVVIATDGNRLAFARIEQSDLVIPHGYMLPTIAAEVVAAECRGETGARLGVSVESVDFCGVPKRGAGWFGCSTEYATITARLTHAEFPAWRDVLPKPGEYTATATFDRDAAIKAIKVAGLYGPATYRRKHRQIVARFDVGVVVVESMTKGDGGSSVTIPAAVVGSLSVGVSSGFLLDSLRHLPPGPVQWALTRELGPTRLLSLTDTAAGEAIVMPIRVDQ